MIEVRPGDTFARLRRCLYVLAPERGREGYDLLMQDLRAAGSVPTRIAHFWMVTGDEWHRPGSSFFHRVQEQGFYSLLFLAQAIADEDLPRPLQMTVVTNGAARVRDEALAYPAKATVAGPARVIPRELPGHHVSDAGRGLAATRRRPSGRGASARPPMPRGGAGARLLEDLLSEPADRHRRPARRAAL